MCGRHFTNGFTQLPVSDKKISGRQIDKSTVKQDKRREGGLPHTRLTLTELNDHECVKPAFVENRHVSCWNPVLYAHFGFDQTDESTTVNMTVSFRDCAASVLHHFNTNDSKPHITSSS